MVKSYVRSSSLLLTKLLKLNQNEIEVSHFFWKSILRFSQLLLLMGFWKKDKHIEWRMLNRKLFRRSEKRKQITRKTQNTKNMISFWRKDNNILSAWVKKVNILSRMQHSSISKFFHILVKDRDIFTLLSY